LTFQVRALVARVKNWIVEKVTKKLSHGEDDIELKSKASVATVNTIVD